LNSAKAEEEDGTDFTEKKRTKRGKRGIRRRLISLPAR
jgi:hypothetical protein